MCMGPSRRGSTAHPATAAAAGARVCHVQFCFTTNHLAYLGTQRGSHAPQDGAVAAASALACLVLNDVHPLAGQQRRSLPLVCLPRASGRGGKGHLRITVSS